MAAKKRKRSKNAKKRKQLGTAGGQERPSKRQKNEQASESLPSFLKLKDAVTVSSRVPKLPKKRKAFKINRQKRKLGKIDPSKAAHPWVEPSSGKRLPSHLTVN